jgi:hypothetical protein
MSSIWTHPDFQRMMRDMANAPTSPLDLLLMKARGEQEEGKK